MLRQTERRNTLPLFWKCLLFSVGVHIAVVTTFYCNPLWVAKFQSGSGYFSPQESLVYSPEDPFLDGVFDHLIVVTSEGKSKFDAPFPTLEKRITMLAPFHDRESFAIAFSPSFSSDEKNEAPLLLKNEPSLALQPLPSSVSSPPVSLSQEEIAYLSVSIPPPAPQAVEEPPPASASQEMYPALALHFQVPNGLFPSLQEIVDYEPLPIQFQLQHVKGSPGDLSSLLPKSVESKQSDLALSNYRLPAWKEEVHWNDLFAVDVRVMPRKEQQEGLYFSITLTPQIEASTKGLQQHFHFVIDGGTSTEKYRLSSFKRALIRSLNYLAEGQTFNIHFAGDQQIHSLASNSLAVSKKTIEQAKKFLEAESWNKSTSRKGSLYSVFKTIQQNPSSGLDTVIFITDGAFLKPKHSSETLQKWLKNASSSSLVLHVATVGNTSHPALLDAMAVSFGGKVLHAPTHASFPRKFAKLLIDMKTPIVTDLTTQLDVDNTDLAISLLGTSCKLSPLFASQSTTFFGIASDPSSFTLKLQGWNEQSPVELSYEVDLKKAKPATISTKQLVLQDKAEYELSLFLSHGEKKYLDQAIEWLESMSPQTRKRL